LSEKTSLYDWKRPQDKGNEGVALKERALRRNIKQKEDGQIVF